MKTDIVLPLDSSGRHVKAESWQGQWSVRGGCGRGWRRRGRRHIGRGQVEFALLVGDVEMQMTKHVGSEDERRHADRVPVDRIAFRLTGVPSVKTLLDCVRDDIDHEMVHGDAVKAEAVEAMSV